MEAYRLKVVDRDYLIHRQAFLNLAVKATKKSGKRKEVPVYSTFDKFFNYDSAINSIGKKKKKTSQRFAGIGRFLKNGGAHNG